MEELPAAEPVRPEFKTPEEALASLGRTHDAVAKATDKTPETVKRAFSPRTLAIGEIQLRPVNMRDWLLLEQIGSPFLKDGSDVSMKELMRTFFILVHPTKMTAALLDDGDESFQESVDEFCESIPLSALTELSKKIGAHLALEFEPQSSFVREEEAGGAGPKLKASSATEQAAG